MSEERKWPLVRAFGGALFLLTVASAAYLFHPLNVSGDLGFGKKAMELFNNGSLTNGGLIAAFLVAASLDCWMHWAALSFCWQCW